MSGTILQSTTTDFYRQQAQASSLTIPEGPTETMVEPANTADTAVPEDSHAMEVDATEEGRKRKAEETTDIADESSNKRQRVAPSDAGPARDREHATVLVSGLSAEVTEADIRKFFRECGQVREVTLSPQDGQVVAAVEFMDRSSVPAALTRDKKTIGESQVHVYQAGQTTLFVTNFPEKMDDTSLRELFVPFGEIVETRWPSRKFKDSRRFCYVQFTTTGAAASASQELDGKELESGFPISVLISDPGRKKERSDAHADARELYVNGLSKFMTDQDMDKAFSPVRLERSWLFQTSINLLPLVVWQNQKNQLGQGRRGKMQGLWFHRI